MSLATFFILLSPFKNLVVNLCMESFRQNGFDSTIEFWLDMMYMPWLGTKPLQMYTALAYVFMMWSTARQVNLAQKFHNLTMQYSKKAKADDCAGVECSGESHTAVVEQRYICMERVCDMVGIKDL